MTHRLRSIPRHIPHSLDISSHTISNKRTKQRTFPNIRDRFIRRTCLSSLTSKHNSLAEESVVLPGIKKDTPLYEYELYFNNSIQFATQEYKKLSNIITKYKTAEQNKNTLTPSNVGKKPIVFPNIRNQQVNSDNQVVLDYNEIQGIKKALYDINKSVVIENEQDQMIDKIVKNNENELRKIFSKERRSEALSPVPSLESISSNDSIPKKEQMRMKWKELQNKNVFRFVIDTASDSISMRRHEKINETDRPERSFKRGGNNSNEAVLPARLQKRRFLPKHRHNESVIIHYDPETKLKNISGRTEKSKQSNAGNTVIDFESYFLEARDTDLSRKSLIKGLLQKEGGMTAFNLDNISVAGLPLQDLFTLYIRIKAAISPTLFNVNPPEFQQFDPAIVNLSISIFSKSEKALIAKYKSYINNPNIFKGFWVNKSGGKIKPICREGMGFASINSDAYIFGGFGSNKLNDL